MNTSIKKNSKNKQLNKQYNYPQQIGGDYYKQKYLYYKNKYLNLKKNIK